MDGLRGFAVILVFFVHYHALFKSQLDPNSISFVISAFLDVNGNCGVDIFFALSGFLIYGALLKEFTFSKFIWRRVQRIYPTFLVVLAIYVAFSFLIPSKSRIPAGFEAGFLYVLENIFLLPGIFSIEPLMTVSWSLSYEFFFYLTLPPLVILLNPKKYQPWARITVIGLLFGAYVVLFYFDILTRPKMMLFLAGILLYEAVKSYKLQERITPKIEILVVFLLGVAFGVNYLLVTQPEILHLAGNAKIRAILQMLMLMTMSFVLILACLGASGLLKTVFTMKPMIWLGNVSYSYYLFHGLVLQFVAIMLLKTVPNAAPSAFGFWLTMPVVFLITFLSSTLLFVSIETRFSFANRASINNESRGKTQRIPQKPHFWAAKMFERLWLRLTNG